MTDLEFATRFVELVRFFDSPEQAHIYTSRLDSLLFLCQQCKSFISGMFYLQRGASVDRLIYIFDMKKQENILIVPS